MQRMSAVLNPFFLSRVCIVLGLLASSGAVANDQETLSLIEGAERKFTTADFAVKSRIFKDQEKNTKPFASGDVEVLIEFGTVPKYSINSKGLGPWSEGDQVNAGHTAAFDGDTEYSIRYTTDLQPYRGFITSNADKNSFQSFVSFHGTRWLLPMFENDGLTAYLNGIPESFPDWKTLDPLGEDKKLKIWVPNYHADPEQKNKRSIELTLDFSRSGNIVKLSFFQNSGTPEEFLYRTVEVKEFKEIDEFWVPSVIDVDQSGEYGTVNFDWRRINFTPKEEDFRLEFPEGMTVIDKMRDVTYVAGETKPKDRL